MNGMNKENPPAGAMASTKRTKARCRSRAAYGCVSRYAKLLGENQAASLLQQNLAEEKETDKKLTQLSNRMNIEAGESEESKRKNSPAKAKPSRA